MTRCQFILIAFCSFAAPVYAQTASPVAPINIGSTTFAGREIEIDGVKALIPDVVVLDYQGRRQRLYSHLIKGKVVLVHFFYTRCTYTCSLQGQDLAELQTLIGTRLGKEVFLISISMDPGTDTPQQLRRWAKAFGVKPGWTLVSGNSPAIKRLTKVLTGNAGPVEMHGAPVFIGNDKSGVWTAVDGLSGAANLAQTIERVSVIASNATESKSLIKF